MNLRITGAVFLLAMMAWTVPAIAGPKLVGNWRVVEVVANGKKEAPPPQVKVTIEFTKGGEFFMRMVATAPDGKVHKKEDGGTYKVKGNKLVTTVKTKVMVKDKVTVKTKVETSTFKIKGQALTLIKPDQKAQLILKRIGKASKASKKAKKKAKKKAQKK